MIGEPKERWLLVMFASKMFPYFFIRWWDEFVINGVVSSWVQIDITSSYSVSCNGFVEVEIYTGQNNSELQISRYYIWSWVLDLYRSEICANISHFGWWLAFSDKEPNRMTFNNIFVDALVIPKSMLRTPNSYFQGRVWRGGGGAGGSDPTSNFWCWVQNLLKTQSPISVVGEGWFRSNFQFLMLSPNLQKIPKPHF